MNLNFRVFVVAFGLLASFSARAQTVPVSPVGRRLDSWIAVFNSGKADRISHYVSESFAPKLLEEMPARMRVLFQEARYHETRGYNIRTVEQESSTSISVFAQGSLTSLWYRITLSVDAEAPHRIASYKAEQIPEPRKFNRALTEQQALLDLGALIHRMVDADAFSGAVLVAHGDRVLFRRAYGYADKAFKVKNRSDTKFNLASVNKMFTAVAVARLIQDGKLSLDDTVGRYLPDYPNTTIRDKATVRQLLTHTAGLGDYFNERYYAARDQLRRVQDYFPLFADAPPVFEPGKGYEYSNAGFVVLGRIIEQASGRSYFDYVRETVFRPAGMVNTDSYELDNDTPNIATGYTNMTPEGRPDFSKRRRMLYNEGVKGSPAGHGYSTVDDLFHFCRGLIANRFVSKSLTSQLTSPQIDTKGIDGVYGFGFEILPLERDTIFGHTGGGHGGMAIVDMYRNRNYTVVVLSNYQRGGNLVAYRLRDLLLNVRSGPTH